MGATVIRYCTSHLLNNTKQNSQESAGKDVMAKTITYMDVGISVCDTVI